MLDYLGNVKARIIPKIVRISFAKFSRLDTRGVQACDNHAGISRRAVRRRARQVSCNWTGLSALRPIE
ncbi:hypothetical protein [Bradyrhizobium sp. Bra78]|uniref:hypothetical protein n=1 Tax=Bradyrhizobium sp. Bra78 TaxID=2926010 RepID=UPI0021C5DE94|nr:hypothetical protein [Bradyrhizobium sp. Bra78]